MYHYKSCGLDNVWLKNGYTERNTKYGEGVSIDDVEGLHRALALEIAKLPHPISPEQFRFLRIELNLSQRRWGGLMGVTDQAIAHYEKGTRSIPRTVDTSLRLYYLESIKEESRVGEMLTELAELDHKLADAEQERLELEIEDGEWHTKEVA